MHLFAPMRKTPPIPNLFGMMAGTTRLELATSAVTVSHCKTVLDIALVYLGVYHGFPAISRTHRLVAGARNAPKTPPPDSPLSI